MKNFTHTKKILMASAVLLSFSVSSQVSKNKVVTKNPNASQGAKQSSTNNSLTEVTPEPFWTEDFGTSDKDGNQGVLATAATNQHGSWDLTELQPGGQKSNIWYVSAMEVGMGQGNCSQLFTEDNTQFNNTLHIGHKDVNGKPDISAKYWKNESSFTDIRIESPLIDCSGKSNITLNFDYFCGGIAGEDFFGVYYFDGTTWSLLANFAPSPNSVSCNALNKALWRSSDTYALPASANNNPEVRIAFRWKNEASNGGNTEDFSVAIDDISVSSTSYSTGGGAGAPTERTTKKIVTKNNIKNQGSNLRASSNNNNNQTVLEQAPFWTEDFGTSDKDGNQGVLATAAANQHGSWDLTELTSGGQKSNLWYVSAMEIGMGNGNCSKSFTEDNTQFNNTLHVAYRDMSGKADFSAKYWKNESSLTDSRIESPLIDCSGRSNIVVNFDYFTGGISGTDFFSLYYFDGSTWNLVTNFGPSAGSTTCDAENKGLWRASDSYILPSSANNNPEVRIGFRWRNEASNGGNSQAFSVAIDDISVSGAVDANTGEPAPLSAKSANKNVETVVNTRADLISIKAVIEKVEPVIYFTTTTEVNPTRELVIENSVDGKNFTKLTDVKSVAQGTISSKLSYTYTDVKAKEGVNYYRVKQTNANGRTIYSKVASVEFRNSGEKKSAVNTPVEVINNNKIDVIDVKAVIEKNEPSIYFTTYTEKYPAKDLIVEGSKDGINYSPISKIKSNAKKDVVGKVAYTYTDANAHEGVNYYRIKQTNADGTVITSKVVSVDFIKVNDKKVTFTVYPNPNSGQFTIDFSGIENNHEVQLVLSDMNDGREIYTTSFYSNSVESNKVDVNPPTKIPTGRYACSLIFEGIKNTVIIMIE